MLYEVSAAVEEKTDKGAVTYQVPTFYLNDYVQGITNTAHARQIAEQVINPTGNKNLKVYLEVGVAT